MEQDWLISALKFIRLNLGIILVSVGLFAVLIWGGITFIQNFPTQSTTQLIAENGQISATATVVATPLAEIMDPPEGPTSPDKVAAPTVATAPAKTLAPTRQPTPSPTPKPILTQLPTTAASPTPTVTPKPTVIPTVKPTPSPTVVPTITPTVPPTSTPVATATPTPTPVSTPTVLPTATPAPEVPIAMTKGGLPISGNPSTKAESSNSKTVSSTGTYTVQKGDSSWKLAVAFLGDGHRYVEIEKTNSLRHNQHLAIGQVLTIPNAATTDTAAAPVITKKGGAAINPGSLPNPGKTYTVQAGDSLWSIAAEQMGNPYQWSSIYQANATVIGHNPGLIYPGQVLQLSTSTTSSSPGK